MVVFVHGGGFVGGDKSVPGTPYSENVGLWACRMGFVGVTMNYRLAPEHRWPAGAEDVAAAVAWLRANVGAHGGEADRIVLMGSSAGASHITPLPGLVACGLPLMVVVAEYDPPVSHRQAALLLSALIERDGRVPHLVFLPGHNHFTEVFHLNTDDRLLGEHTARFVGAGAAAREPSAAR